METVCYKIKLKPNSLDKVRDWGKRLMSESSEVAKLLKHEGIIIESAFIEQASEGDFLIYYLRAHDLKKAREVSAASTHPIDIFHRKVMSEIGDGGSELEKVLDIEAAR